MVGPAEVQQFYQRRGLDVTVDIGEPINSYWGPGIVLLREGLPYASFSITQDNKVSLMGWNAKEGLEDKLLAGTEDLARGLALNQITLSDVHNDQFDMSPLSDNHRTALLRNGYWFKPKDPKGVAQGDFAYCNREPCIPGEWIKAVDGSIRPTFANLPPPYVLAVPTTAKTTRPKPLALRMFPFLYSRETREFFDKPLSLK